MASSVANAANCVWQGGAELGEAPVWIARKRALYWVDILGCTLFRYTPARAHTEACAMPFAVSAIAPTADGRLLCAGQRQICVLDERSHEMKLVTNLDDQNENIRINDGCCHADGAFWFGTMDLTERVPTGHFFRLAGNGTCERIDVACVVTNGPAFNADGSRGYFVDSVGGRILCAPLRDGRIDGPLQIFAKVARDQGFPDGLAIDVEGGVWCCHWGGGRITRFDTAGRISDVLRLPVTNVTKCAFGGDALDRLYVTSARKGLERAALDAEPLAGALFEIEVDYRGFAPTGFREIVRNETERTCNFQMSWR